ncbi:MAG: hypothetical protein GYB64_12735, partial [Chloroflexi bacterium]|nr:hypothetical protein [Chloroflexota bacterium]
TPLPSPTPLDDEETAAAPDDTTPAPQPTDIPSDAAPIPGTFDVYIGAPDESGSQLLRWVEGASSRKITEISVQTGEQSAVRAGEYVYYVDPASGDPIRVNTAGAESVVDFAAPPADASAYQLLPSATGRFLGWLVREPDGTAVISLAAADGTDARTIAEIEAEPDTAIQLIRVSNDGSQVFFDRRPADITDGEIFIGYHEIHIIDAASGEVSVAPGEPACGEDRACGGRVSPDGAYMVRTLPPARSGTPIIVTNLINGSNIARFDTPTVPAGARYEIGDPFFTPTPGGSLIYIIGYGAPGLENYQIVFANLVTGEQELVTDLGADRLRPLGWTAGGSILLAHRDTEYDTWQLTVEDGSRRQIAGLLFLGTIVVEPETP